MKIIENKNNKFDYEFNCINPTDYILTFEVSISNRMIKYIFMKAREQIIKQRLKKPEDFKEDIPLDKFDLPQQYLKLMNVSMTSFLKDVKNQVSQDNIIILEHKLERGYFEKLETVWKCKLIYGGCYIDKR